MTLRDRLTDEMKTAMKSREEARLSAIRLIRASVKNREIEQKKELDDAGITEIIGTLVKQRRESIRMFSEAARHDLVEKEEKELAILLDFLPTQLSAEELAGIVDQVVAETGAAGAADIGKVMKVLMPRVAGRADGREVSDLVRRKLS
ncbi:MAG TPA: GatB/YqeY domain-containing protein [Verrucomicrobiae bacterium]|nr:GatB/YqeY domain-containing protein [Verrucomicrobiae bacterium]